MAITQIASRVRDRFVITCENSPLDGDTKKPVIVSTVPAMALMKINFLFFVKKAMGTKVIQRMLSATPRGTDVFSNSNSTATITARTM